MQMRDSASGRRGTHARRDLLASTAVTAGAVPRLY